MGIFKLYSNFKPMGDQPDAINALVENIKNGVKEQPYWELREQERPLP